MNPSLALLLVATAGSAAAAPAPQITRGMLRAWPNGLSTDDIETGASIDPMKLKAPGNQSQPPSIWYEPNPTVVKANYSRTAMFGGLGLGIAADIEIDAQSTGNDQIPDLDSEHVPIVGGNDFNWLAWVITLDKDAEGTTGSWIEYLFTNNIRERGAELIGYYADRSVNIAEQYRGATTVEATALTQGYTNQEVDNIDAMDYALGIHTFDTTGDRSNILFSVNDEYFFSVSQTWANGHQHLTQFAADTSTGTTVYHTPSGQDIYHMTWTGPGTGWGGIELYRKGADMGLGSGEDIDALAVNALTHIVAFSLERATAIAPRDVEQLRIHEPSMGPISYELKDRLRGNPGVLVSVTDRLDVGGERDDVDSLCGIDPALFPPALPSTPDNIAGVSITSTAAMAPSSVPLGKLMNMSLIRGIHPSTGTDTIIAEVNGWPGVTPQLSEVQFWGYIGSAHILPDANPIASPTSGWVLLETKTRTASQETVQYKQEWTAPVGTYTFAVMAILLTPPATSGSEPDGDSDEGGEGGGDSDGDSDGGSGSGGSSSTQKILAGSFVNQIRL